MRDIWRTMVAMCLALCVSAPAFALGLGQLQVRSQAGEPLLAEIPVVSSDPAELQALRARLASPETFARIGLQPPEGTIADLQFNVALDAQGRPVIRVTTLAPVQEPMLTFLVEVDWGQGRLVREYSALLDVPDTLAAPAQPPIQAPQPAQAAGAGTIARESGAPEPSPEPEPAAAPAPEPVAEAAPEPTEETDAVAPTAAAGQAPAPPAAATSMRSTPGQYGPVQAGDTLSQIAQRVAPDDDVTVNQMMLALLRSNPEAFIGGNINRIRQGAVLQVPSRADVASIGAREATAEVRAQVAQWRELSQPAPQPEAVASAAGDDGAAPAADGGAATADARLEIVPPGEGGTQQAGIRSGISAGGEGDMLRQELQQVQETLAARDAEVEELKARLTELERLQQQQAQLIELKDSELAAAQQHLEASNQRAAEESTGAMPWVLGGLGVLLAGALLFWILNRRTRAPSFRTPAAAAPTPAPTPAPAPRAPPASGPTWHSGEAAKPPHAGTGAAAFAAAPETRPAGRPEPDAGPAQPAPVADAAADADAGTVDGAAQERIELARAYVELGDVDTARGLLQEIVDDGPPAARDEASRVLRGLG